MTQPATRYEVSFQQAMQRTAAEKEIVLDTQQQRLITQLDGLIAPLLTGQARGKNGDGLYVWGLPGRGKTFIVDAFFRWVPLTKKKRIHFHLFFRELHQTIARGSSVDAAIAASINDCQLLCFDEFHLHDIGDAMLIKPLLIQLFQRGVLLVATSNHPPENLLANPLYHQRFVPSIELIQQHMTLVALTGGDDYRTRQHQHDPFSTGAMLPPGAGAWRQQLMLPEPAAAPLPLPVGYRTLEVLSPAQEVLHFSFHALCETPTAVMDYLALSQHYHRWLIEDVPPLESVSPAVQQRFINLIDVLYDSACQLFITTTCSLPALTQGVELDDIQRTASRLALLSRCQKPD
ncbi:cell division protein ZapE [Mixta intestinalis]|uniref:Cell division protein ZapE n=1 Tax=Mixta intestinalis TaxID=1615494 RepID=A0A6P1PVQ7_9GAMM|nr:cell division protein ZapE [Mixta intestinalis]QHM70067.1 Cell division protein ZapE [Mixta intestinalis]